MKLKNLASTQVRHARAGGHPGPRSSRGQALDSRFRGNDSEGARQLQNLLLVSICFLFVLPLTTTCSKSKKEQTKEQSQAAARQTEPEAQPTFYQDDLYPLRIDFIPGLNVGADRGERRVKGTERYFDDTYKYTYDPLAVWMSNPEMLNSMGEYESWRLFSIDFFPMEEGFKDHLRIRRHPLEMEGQLVFFGNIPAFRIKGSSSGYLLLTPGTHGFLVIVGDNIREHNPEEISQEFSDKVAQTTKQMLQRLQWLKPIDVNSQEFKDWKAHILDLVNEVNQAKANKANK